MHLTKRHLPKHARARLIAWALAMLMWLGAALSGAIMFTARHERQRAQRMSVAHLWRMVMMLIISRASDFARIRAPMRHTSRGRPRALRSLIRALVGSRVRRMLRRRALGAQIAALIRALRHIDAYAQAIAKRIRRRLTRRMPVRTTLDAGALLVSLAAPEILCADSS